MVAKLVFSVKLCCRKFTPELLNRIRKSNLQHLQIMLTFYKHGNAMQVARQGPGRRRCKAILSALQ